VPAPGLAQQLAGRAVFDSGSFFHQLNIADKPSSQIRYCMVGEGFYQLPSRRR